MERTVHSLVGSLRWSLRRTWRQLAFWSGTPMKWRGALIEEEDYWDQYLKEMKGKSGGRLDPTTELSDDLKDLLREVGTKARILDVGAGPLTVLGKCWNGQKLNITATDPLAPKYDLILGKYGIRPPIRTIHCDGERLVDRLGKNKFDLAYAKNSIDHSYDPMKVIDQMVEVTRPGGFIWLEHYLNEAEMEQYIGLHQWNLDLRDGRFIIWNRNQSVDVADELKSKALLVRAERLPERWYQGKLEDPWFCVIFKKTSPEKYLH